MTTTNLQRYPLVLFGVVIGVVIGSLITALAITQDVKYPQLADAVENSKQLMSLTELRKDVAQIKQKLGIPGAQEVEQHNVGANPMRQIQGPADNVHPSIAASPSPQEEARFQTLSQRVNQQLVSRTLTLPAVLEDPEVQTLPQSFQKKLVLDIVKRVNNKELDIKAVLPD